MKTSRKTYHHGNLRQTLIDNALKTLAKKKPEELSLRALAVEAGVSPNAPYRHFRDKEALLEVVAAQGFQQMTQELKQTQADGPKRRFREMADHYVKFALANPALYTVMMEHPYGDAFKEFHESIMEFVRVLIGEVTAGEEVVRATTATWSLLHGSATLAIHAKGDSAELSVSGDELARMLSKGIR